MLPIRPPNILRLVSLSTSEAIHYLTYHSWLPESPRYLISKDREEEAFDILVKYHAEGDRHSLFVRAEMTEIKTTIKLEMEISKQSWLDMIKTAGMRRRVFIASMMGLFTQWSGNTLISYYLSTILGMIGYNTTYAKTRINSEFILALAQDSVLIDDKLQINAGLLYQPVLLLLPLPASRAAECSSSAQSPCSWSSSDGQSQ